MFAAFVESVQSLWQYTLLDNSVVHLRLGNLALGVIVFLAGWRLGRWLVHRGMVRFIASRGSGNTDHAWLENFLGFLLVLIMLVTALVIVGIPASIFGYLWHFSLFELEGHGIELGNVILGLVLLYPGVRFSRYLSDEFQNIVLARLRLDPASQNLLTVLVRYFLIIVVALFVLTLVGIPLTAFTVIGGALAIGVGLGSQNLVNNFLSGLVLMIERPLKVGDVVEVDERRGVVEHIGGRSTRIRTVDNLRLVMPNSKLLENTVINWSLIDNYIRREITVGVAYGSDVDQTVELFKQAIVEHPRVEKTPKPIVLFEDFGDNALSFRGIFWTRFREAVRPRITESEIRFKINHLFNEAGIVIAFPQRDVHLDTAGPLEVRITNPQSKPASDPE